MPVSIAVSGKRNLRGDDGFVRLSLDAAFAALDAALPGVPKLLLTGLAEGSDTIAAELALARPNWRVDAVLPLTLAIYQEDFAGSSRRMLRRLLADPAVEIRELRPLIDPATGAPSAAGALRTPPGGSNELRDRHYEQQGLWLSDHAALLIAVKPADEAPELVGGTARIVAYRLGAAPDAIAREVIATSRELAPPPGGHGGAVWLIDAPREAGSPRRGRRFAVLLPPEDEARAGRRGFAYRFELSLRAAREAAGLSRPTPAATRDR